MNSYFIPSRRRTPPRIGSVLVAVSSFQRPVVEPETGLLQSRIQDDVGDEPGPLPESRLETQRQHHW